MPRGDAVRARLHVVDEALRGLASAVRRVGEAPPTRCAIQVW